MKTKELIRLLQEADPSGELECCVENIDILGVYPELAYWDGAFQVLVRDNSKKPYYDVVGAKYIAEGTKITISPHSIDDAIFDHRNLPVEYIGMSTDQQKRYEKSVQEKRDQAFNIKNEVSRDSFKQYVQNKFPELSQEAVEKSAFEYYNKHMSFEDEMPDDIKKMFTMKDGMKICPSWNERRSLQWDRELDLKFVENQVIITKKEN